jgi:hypothetical protein
MKDFKAIVLATLAFAWLGAVAQEITVEEMQLLDKLRAQFQEKGIQLKPEDEIRYLQRMRAMRELSTSANRAGATPAQPLQPQPSPQLAPAPQTISQQPIQQPFPQQQIQPQPLSSAAVQPLVNGVPSEEQLRKQLDSLPPGNQLKSFVLLRDGLQFNGQRFADPEGTAKSFALDPDTSTAAYLVNINSTANVKIARIGTNSAPVTIGKVSVDGSRTVFQSATGKTLAGDLFFPLTDGVLLVRESVGFRYVVGEGTRQIDLPSGWSPAPLQRGNASTTGWFLLERDTTEEQKNPFSSFMSLGAMVGVVAGRMDYALFNLNDRRMVPFEVSTDGKTVATYSQCRRMPNGLVNKCDQMRTYESVWSPDGSPNSGHYFWKIDWQKMDGKPVAVVMENSLRQVNAYDLTGSKKVNLLERTLGINNWSMSLAEGGKFRINAQLAFDKVVIEDVALELQNRPDVPRRQ